MAAIDTTESRWSGTTVGVAGTTLFATLAIVLLTGTRSEAKVERLSSSHEVPATAIAWVHRFGGAAEDDAPRLEIVDRHRDDAGVEWTLIRRSDDGRHAILEQRADSDRWWLHVRRRSDVGTGAPRISNSRSRDRWRIGPVVQPVALPAGDLRRLRDALQRWRQEGAG